MDLVKSIFGFSETILQKGGNILNNIKERLSKLGKTQVWLLKKLREIGLEVQPPQLCNIINGIYTYPKAKSVLEECENILSIEEMNTLA